MLENCATNMERWGGVDRIVNQLFKQRQGLLVIYCNVCGLNDSKGGRNPAKLKQLCASLVDYVSTGHFEVYEQLLQEANAFEEDGSGLLARYYPAIERSTEMALHFNDTYAETYNFRELSKDLSNLGEVLESRFSAEDKLIEALHSSHRVKIVR